MMAVKTGVVLLADAGDVTVARRTAFYTYGKFEVILPEGREQQETDNRIQDGYIARAHDGNVGRFDFGFIRADATVNIDAGTSDLETQIDSAELRAEGDVFFEGDITPAGFNGFIPGVDYGVGDIVTVRRWGTSLALPVTSIEMEVSESGGTRASRVHVSGQLIHDAASRRRSNDDLRQQIAAEKRERLRQVGAVDSKATQAKDTAESAESQAKNANQVATTANNAAEQAQRSADGKSTIFYGATTPTSAKAGDTWFKDVAGGGTVLMQYVNGKWVEKVNTKAIDDELAANQDALTELNDVVLPTLKQELEALDTVVAQEAAEKIATLEKKLADADKALKQDLQGELAALDETLSGELTTKLETLRGELDALDSQVALDVASKLATLETKLANADKALKQELQGDLTALDEALSGDLTSKMTELRNELQSLDEDIALDVASKLATLETKLANADTALKQELQGELNALDDTLSGDLTNRLAGLKKDLEDADTAAADAVATTLTQLENRLKAADKTVKDDLVKQLGELEEDLAALDTTIGQNLTSKLAALKTELQQADTSVTNTLRGELSTLRTQLQDADDAIANDLSKTLEDNRKALKEASDTIAKDLAGVDMLVNNQRPGNLFPDPFFKHSLWGSRYLASEECLEITANGTTNGAYYFPDGYDVYSHLMTLEPGASYLLTMDVRFGGNEVVESLHIYSRYQDVDGTRKVPLLGRITRANEINYKWGTTSLVLTMPDDVASEVTIGFYVSSIFSSGNVRLRNVRLHRAADDSLIIDGAVTAAKVKAGVIDTDHIAAGAIVATRLAADSVVAGKIAANAVTAGTIKAGEVTTNALAADAVTAEKIKAGQVTTNALAADAVTANKIKAGQVTTEALAADAVTSNKIKAGQVTTNALAADAVTANKIAAGQVNTNALATDAVTANKIKAGQVTTEKIAAGAVTADELQAENATIDKLWANGIAAKSVTTNRILVANNGNMLPEIATYVAADKKPEIDPYPSPFNPRADNQTLWITGSTSVNVNHPLNLVAGQKYRFSYRINATVDSTTHYWQLMESTVDGSIGQGAPVQIDGRTSTYLITNEVANRAIREYVVEFEIATTGTYCLRLFPNHSRGADNTGGYQWFRDLRLEKMTGATLIEDGAITTNKIAANAVTADAIKADAVTANAIKSGEVAAKHLAADAVSATKLLAEEATIDKLWANGIAAKSITASRLTVSPGNMFPDPNFQDPSWGWAQTPTGISLDAIGSQRGVYLQPEGQHNASMQHVPGVNYLLTAHLRFGGTAGVDKVSVYARFENESGGTTATKVGEFPRFPKDGQEHASYRYRDNSTVLDLSNLKMAAGGFFTLGFFVERSSPDGSVEIRNVRLTPMSGTTLIEDGAVTTGKVAANAITSNEVAADQILAKHVKSDQILAKHVKSGEIKAEHLLAEEATIDKLWANGLVAKTVQTASLSVGAANLYRDPALLDADSFDDRRSDTGGYGGGGSFTVAPSTSNTGGYDTLGAAKGRPTRLVPGVTYYVSAMVRPDRLVAAGNLRLYLRAYPTADATGTQGWASPQLVSNKVSVSGGTWHRIEGTFKMHAEYEYLVMGFYVGSASQAQARFSDPMVIRQHSATMIQDGAITTGKVAANAITANELKADSVTADAIKSGEVAAKHLAADAVTANKLLAEDATIDKLWANGIAAKSLVTNRVLVAGNGNMLPEIATYATSTRPEIDPYPRPFGLNTSHPSIWITGRSTAAIHHPLNLVAGQKYRFSYRVSASVNGTRHFWQFINGTADGVSAGGVSVKVGSSTSSYVINNEVANTAIRSYDVEFEAITTGTHYLQVYPNHTNGAENDTGYQWFRDLRLEKMTGATLIEDGAVTTNKIAADAVTAESIKAGEITSDHISSSKISSDKITVKNGFIKNAMIDNGEITNAKIANLDASKITAGTINANRIGAKTIEGKHLAVDTIEANQIKANVFTQVANSVLPLIPGTVTPTWTDGLRYVARSGTKDAELPAGIPGYYRHPSGTIAAGATASVSNTYNNVVSIDPNLEYEATWWVRSSAGSPRFMYVTLEDQNGATDIVQQVEGVDDDGNAYSKHTWGNPIRVIITSASTTWTKYSTIFTFKEGTKSVRVHNVYFDNSTNSSASYLYIAGLEISPHIIPQRDVDERQDQAISKMEEYVRQLTEIFFSQSASYAKKFNELSEPMSGGLRAGEDEPGVMTTTTTTITCTPGWVGHILVHYVHPSAGGIDTPGLSVARHEVTGSNRTFSIPSGRTSRSGSAAIHWFKRAGRPYTTDMSTGAQSATYDTWKTLSETSVGTGAWNLTATVGWDAATNHNKYGIRILVNGSVVAQVAPRSGLGPLLPIGDGYRTQSVSASGDGNGRTTTFQIQAYTDATTSASGPRRIRRVNATLDWTQIN